MSSTTYGLENAYPNDAKRTATLQRPLQIFVAAGDFLLILMSYLGASLIYGTFFSAVAESDVSNGAGLIVGVVFVGIGYLQGTYDNHRLLNVAWQLRCVFIRH
jgi:putative colanic acid biosynthesis UDP-glucose lipid carrier transferase